MADTFSAGAVDLCRYIKTQKRTLNPIPKSEFSIGSEFSVEKATLQQCTVSPFLAGFPSPNADNAQPLLDSRSISELRSLAFVCSLVHPDLGM